MILAYGGEEGAQEVARFVVGEAVLRYGIEGIYHFFHSEGFRKLWRLRGGGWQCIVWWLRCFCFCLIVALLCAALVLFVAKPGAVVACWVEFRIEFRVVRAGVAYDWLVSNDWLSGFAWVHWTGRDFALALSWHVVRCIAVFNRLWCRRCGSYTSLDWSPGQACVRLRLLLGPMPLRARTGDNTLGAGRGAGSKGFNCGGKVLKV